jgi:hypothetical protein
MSAECERVFSAAGKMVIPLRTSLEAQTIGICRVLRSWYRADILHGKDNNISLLAPWDSIGGDETRLDWLESDGEVYSEDSGVEDEELLTSGSDSE